MIQRIRDVQETEVATATVTQLYDLYLALGAVSDSIFDVKGKLLEIVFKHPIKWENINWENKTYKFLGREIAF